VRPLDLRQTGLEEYPVDRAMVHTQLRGNDADLPLLDMKVTQDFASSPGGIANDLSSSYRSHPRQGLKNLGCLPQPEVAGLSLHASDAGAGTIGAGSPNIPAHRGDNGCHRSEPHRFLRRAGPAPSTRRAEFHLERAQRNPDASLSLFASAIAALALGMGEAAPARSLVAPPGLSAGLTAGSLRAALTSIDVAPVAVATDHHLAATTGTVEQTRTALHRPLLPMRAGLKPDPKGYSPVGRASHGLGARYRGDCGGQSRCRACLSGPDGLADSA